MNQIDLTTKANESNNIVSTCDNHLPENLVEEMESLNA